jgi:hypothetical protein
MGTLQGPTILVTVDQDALVASTQEALAKINAQIAQPTKQNSAQIVSQIASPLQAMTAILAAVQGRYQMLFALLAGCGPMRAGEALGLEIGKSGLLFHTSSGAQILQSNLLRDSLYPTLEKLEHVKGGLNIFRRYRLTLLGKSDCPDVLKHFWSGHAPKHVSERYEKLHGEREYRLQWAERIGLGFKIPASVGLPGLLRVVASAA